MNTFLSKQKKTFKGKETHQSKIKITTIQKKIT